MNPIRSYIPRGGLYKHQESSSLDSLKERNSLLHQWRSQGNDARRIDKTGSFASQLRTQVARLGNQQKLGNGLYPFKIYQFPSSLRRFHNDDDWRRFKVRDGKFTFSGGVDNNTWGSDLTAAGDIFSPDTDQFGLLTFRQRPPSTNIQTDSDGISSTWNEISLPADDITYHFGLSFVIPIAGEVGITKNAYRTGIIVVPETDPTVSKIMLTLETFDATNCWRTVPVSDPYNYYIGSVIVNSGTGTYASSGYPQTMIYQYRYDNILLPGLPYRDEDSDTASTFLLHFRGTYSDTSYYYAGDVVLITYADSTGVNSLYQCVYDPNKDSIYYPPNIPGPMTGISPNGNSPDPWRVLSKSPSDADYHNGAYDGSKFYLRT